MQLKSIAFGALLALAASSSAFGQCAGNPPAGRLCGNSTAAPTLPGWQTMSAMLDRNFGGPSVQGTMLNRGASFWSATATPSLGLNGTASGSLTLNGSSTGSATIGVKAAAGSVTFNLPITNGSTGFALITDGSGNTSWASAAATLPYLQAYLSANQTGISDSVATLININTVVVDSTTAFNTTTHLYTPLLAGKYLVTVKARCAVATLMTACVADIGRNGGSFARASIVPGSTAQSDAIVTAIVQMNGTTDTISAIGTVIGSGGSDQFNGGTAPEVTWLTAQYIGL